MASLSTMKAQSECSRVVWVVRDGVVWLDDGGGDLGSGVDGEFELGLLAVVDGEPLHEQGGESGAGATAEAVEDEESLETGTLVSQLPDPVQDEVDDFLADGVVTTGVVVGGVLLAGDELLGVEQLAVGAGADLIDYGGLQIDKDGTWHVLAGAGLAEEGVEGVITTTDGLVAGHLTVGLDAVLETVQLPAGITDLDSGLTDVDGDTLTHVESLCSEVVHKK